MADAVIQTRGLTRSFDGRRAVDDLTVDVHAGEVTALLGPNGAGKTTTVRLLNGVLRPDAGDSRVLGLDPAVDGDAVRARTGVVTEAAGLDDRLTALENLELYARIRGVPAADARRRATDLLDRFALGDRARQQVQGFSTGQRKRVALGRALMHDPEVLFLDEPTSGLDPEATRDVVHLIGGLAREGRTIVLATHFLAEAGRLCQRMIVLDQGRLQASGRPHELAEQLLHDLAVDVDLGRPADDAVVSLLRDLPGVSEVTTSADGVALRVATRDVVAVVVGALVAREVPVYAAVPRLPTLEDVYFALQGEAPR